MGKGIIIYGPAGCGKTLHAAEIAAAYGKTRIIDPWVPGDEIPDDAICLTNAIKRAVSFENAMSAVGDKDKGMQAFIEKYCIVDPTAETSCYDFLDAFQQAGNVATGSELGILMKKHFKIVTHNGRKFFSGVRLTMEPTCK